MQVQMSEILTGITVFAPEFAANYTPFFSSSVSGFKLNTVSLNMGACGQHIKGISLFYRM